jgi:hypothetical protein
MLPKLACRSLSGSGALAPHPSPFPYCQSYPALHTVPPSLYPLQTPYISCTPGDSNAMQLQRSWANENSLPKGSALTYPRWPCETDIITSERQGRWQPPSPRPQSAGLCWNALPDILFKMFPAHKAERWQPAKEPVEYSLAWNYSHRTLLPVGLCHHSSAHLHSQKTVDVINSHTPQGTARAGARWGWGVWGDVVH